MYEIIFIAENNKKQYKKALLSWLKSDFIKQGFPQNHFWHNQEIIGNAFDSCHAMVVINKQKKIIGYMIWTSYEGGAEIDIIEVKKEYRKKGIAKKMLSEFSEKFSDVYLLCASVLPQAVEFFTKIGWESTIDHNQRKKFFKIIRTVLEPLNELPDGKVIGICSEDFYKVKNNPLQYQHLMRYFPIELDADKKLRVPIATTFIYEGYISIYLNKELIAEGKARHLFANQICHGTSLLVINKIEPLNPELFMKKRFFAPLIEGTQDKEATGEPLLKRRRLEGDLVFFQQEKTVREEERIKNTEKSNLKFLSISK